MLNFPGCVFVTLFRFKMHLYGPKLLRAAEGGQTKPTPCSRRERAPSRHAIFRDPSARGNAGRDGAIGTRTAVVKRVFRTMCITGTAKSQNCRDVARPAKHSARRRSRSHRMRTFQLQPSCRRRSRGGWARPPHFASSSRRILLTVLMKPSARSLSSPRNSCSPRRTCDFAIKATCRVSLPVFS